MANLPFLTLPDPMQAGEGALDPLGLATLGDLLAEQILTGLRARMSRPRFLTALAVSAAVCDGLEETLAADGVTPAYLVFEWLLVEGFVRAGRPEEIRHTPGILKAVAVGEAGESMSARTYLRTASVFGFHGVYKPLGRNLGIVDEELRLADNGYELLKIWQTEQGLQGFLDSSVSLGQGRTMRQLLRAAVEDGLGQGFTRRSAGWQGWTWLADHLAPGRVGPGEAAFLIRRLLDPLAAPRGELFRLLRASTTEPRPEHVVAADDLLPAASGDFAARLQAIDAYEAVCGIVEQAFDWIRYLSSHAQARPVTASEFVETPGAARLASALPSAIQRAEAALAVAPLLVQRQFTLLARSFETVQDAASLFELVLDHHARVQGAKKPDGKRPWFERSGPAVFIRAPYRISEPPNETHAWHRPYRIATARSFIGDLTAGAHALA